MKIFCFVLLPSWTILARSTISLFCFLIKCVFPGAELLIQFKNFFYFYFFACTCWLTVDRFIIAFDMPFSLSVNFLAFALKWLSEILPFSGTLKSHFRVINWLNFSIIVSQGMRRPEERERDGGTANGWGSQNTHNLYLLSLAVFYGYGLRCLKNITIATSNITDHHNKYSNGKIWTIVRIMKMWDRTEWANAFGKMVLIDLFYSGLPQIFNLWNCHHIKKMQ